MCLIIQFCIHPWVHTFNFSKKVKIIVAHRVPTPIPPSSTQGKVGRNHLNEEIRRVIQPNRFRKHYCTVPSPLPTHPSSAVKFSYSTAPTQPIIRSQEKNVMYKKERSSTKFYFFSTPHLDVRWGWG
jgi:hypothetical protein